MKILAYLWITLVLFWVSGCSKGTANAPLASETLQTVIANSTRGWNLTEAPDADVNRQEVLRELKSVLSRAHAMLLHTSERTPRHIAELSLHGVAPFLSSLFKAYGTRSPEDLQNWAEQACSFLTSQAQHQLELLHSAGAVHQGTSSASRQLLNAAAQAPTNNTAALVASVSGLPLVRRVLLAQLLSAWLTGLQGQIAQSSPVDEALSCMLSQLHRLQINAVMAKGILANFHISKAGGTSWTKAAKINKCTPAVGRGARVSGFDDQNRWLNRPLFKQLTRQDAAPWGVWGHVERDSSVHTCHQRFADVSARAYNYITNEYTLHGGLHDMYDTHMCPHFVNAVTLREPGERLMSNLKFITVTINNHMRREPKKHALFREVFCSTNASFWEQMTPAIADNYITRSFLGERGFHSPLWSVGPEHVALAKALLLQFDLVLDLGAGDSATGRAMRAALGWGTTLSEVHILNVNKLAAKSSVDFDVCSVAEAGEQLLPRQEPDRQLYRFGRTLARLDSLFLDAATELGSKPWAEGMWGGVEERLAAGTLPCGLLGVAERKASVTEGAEGGDDDDWT